MRQNEDDKPDTAAEISASELSDWLSFLDASEHAYLPTNLKEKLFDINGTIYKPNKRYLRIGVTDGSLYQSDKHDLPDDEWEKCEEHEKR